MKNEIKEMYKKVDRVMMDIPDDIIQPFKEIQRKHKYETNINEMDYPKFVLTSPNFSFIENGDYEINNAFMKRYILENNKGGIEEFFSNRFLIYSQWMDIYKILSQFGIVFTMPSPVKRAKDLVFTANAGVLIPGDSTKTGKEQIILSNFRSKQRTIETAINKDFFNLMGYETVFPSGMTFEGYADLKPINLNKKLWVGGYGIRTQVEFYEWMMENFDINIIPIKMDDEELYHFDCNFFVINENNFIVSDVIDKESIKILEKYGEIHLVTKEDSYMGICNSVKIGTGFIMCGSDIEEMEKNDPYYIKELNKVNRLNEICYKVGVEPIYVDISGFYDLGAGLSCLVMPLDYDSILDV